MPRAIDAMAIINRPLTITVFRLNREINHAAGIAPKATAIIGKVVKAPVPASPKPNASAI